MARSKKRRRKSKAGNPPQAGTGDRSISQQIKREPNRPSLGSLPDSGSAASSVISGRDGAPTLSLSALVGVGITLYLISAVPVIDTVPSAVRAALFLALGFGYVLANIPMLRRTLKFGGRELVAIAATVWIAVFMFLGRIDEPVALWWQDRFRSRAEAENAASMTIVAIATVIPQIILVARARLLASRKGTFEKAESEALVDYFLLRGLPAPKRRMWQMVDVLSLGITGAFIIYSLLFQEVNFSRIPTYARVVIAGGIASGFIVHTFVLPWMAVSDRFTTDPAYRRALRAVDSVFNVLTATLVLVAVLYISGASENIYQMLVKGFPAASRSVIRAATDLFSWIGSGIVGNAAYYYLKRWQRRRKSKLRARTNESSDRASEAA